MGDNSELIALDGTGQEVSFKLYQDVYNSITGKTEKLVRNYYGKFHVKLDDFDQLHNIIAQTIEQYDCRSSILNIVAQYSDGRSERFSGIERFRLQGVNRNACVENIDFQYDFLFILPGTSEPKKYRLEVFLISSVGIEDRLFRTEANDYEKFMNNSFSQNTGRIDISYIDLAVARNLEGQVDEWFRALPQTSYGWLSKLAQKLPRFLPFIVKFFGFLAFGISAKFLLLPMITDLKSMFTAVVIVIAAGFVMSYFTSVIYSPVRKRFDMIKPRSLIELSKCDREKKSSLDGTVLQSWLVFFGMIIVSILSGFASTVLGRFLGY
jgi:hypothetical protein